MHCRFGYPYDRTACEFARRVKAGVAKARNDITIQAFFLALFYFKCFVLGFARC